MGLHTRDRETFQVIGGEIGSQGSDYLERSFRRQNELQILLANELILRLYVARVEGAFS